MKEILGASAILIGCISYVPYFRTIFSGKTKPHAFSWLVWGILTAIAFGGQIVGKGGAGAWVTGFGEKSLGSAASIRPNNFQTFEPLWRLVLIQFIHE